MADNSQKWDDNVPGEFYVDKECILCSLCTDIAPEHFKESEGEHLKCDRVGRGALLVSGCSESSQTQNKHTDTRYWSGDLA